MKKYQVIWGGKNNTIIPKNFCFPEETKITMENNVIKEIQDVIAGDKVIAYDLETKEKVVEPVGGVDKVLDELYILNDGMIETSKEHPFRVKKVDGSEVWASLDKDSTHSHYESLDFVEQMEKGDKIFTQNDEWIELKSIEKKPDIYTAYNILNVGENRNYYANNFLVHNEFSIGMETLVVSGSSLEGTSSITTHESLVVGDTVLAASIEGLPDTDVAAEFLLWEYTGSDIASQITLVTASIESILTSSHADFKLIETPGKSEPLKITDNHPLLAKTGSIWAFEYVGDIDVTYTLVSSSLEEVEINSITQITGSQATGSFRRFDVEPQDTYFADGILIHN